MNDYPRPTSETAKSPEIFRTPARLISQITRLAHCESYNRLIIDIVITMRREKRSSPFITIRWQNGAKRN